MQEVKLLVEGLQSGTGGGIQVDTATAEIPPTVSCNPPYYIVTIFLKETVSATFYVLCYGT